MALTYCGKDCANCAYRESADCPGCKLGPGNQTDNICEIAKCCRSKGHIDCTSCTLSAHCGPLMTRRDAPQQRKKKQEAEAFLSAELHKRAVFMGRWLIALFLTSAIQGLGLFFVVFQFQGLRFITYPAGLVTIGMGFVYSIILLFLSKETEAYRPAGVCTLLAAAICTVAVTVLRNDRILPPLFFLFAGCLTLVSVFFEIKGHTFLLTGIDNALATKWETLMLVQLITFGALLARTVLVDNLTQFGSYVLTIVAVVWIAFRIGHAFYILITGKRFRQYAKQKG